jgi:hypothetical protein
VNSYLYGLQEIVGWQFAVDSRKSLAFTGRGPDDGPVALGELPAGESLRVQLEGSPPNVDLWALPALCHAIHTRLAERIAAEDAPAARMDEVLAFLDSKWNGFTFQPPYTKDRLPFVFTAHRLFTDGRGFAFRFPSSAHLASVGDVPFMSNTSYVEFAQRFMELGVSTIDFVRRTPDSQAVLERFRAESTYLARYKMLIELIAHAVLTPNLRLPGYLRAYDFPEGVAPTERVLDARFDVPRKHALLLWAYAAKDPVAVADFLYENLFSIEGNQFPADVSLPVQLTLLVREKEPEMLAAVLGRIVAERPESGVPGDFEREFSPHATYLDSSAETAADYLIESFSRFHEPVFRVIREAAHGEVAKVFD